MSTKDIINRQKEIDAAKASAAPKKESGESGAPTAPKEKKTKTPKKTANTEAGDSGKKSKPGGKQARPSNAPPEGESASRRRNSGKKSKRSPEQDQSEEVEVDDTSIVIGPITAAATAAATGAVIEPDDQFDLDSAVETRIMELIAYNPERVEFGKDGVGKPDLINDLKEIIRAKDRNQLNIVMEDLRNHCYLSLGIYTNRGRGYGEDPVIFIDGVLSILGKEFNEDFSFVEVLYNFCFGDKSNSITLNHDEIDRNYILSITPLDENQHFNTVQDFLQNYQGLRFVEPDQCGASGINYLKKYIDISSNNYLLIFNPFANDHNIIANELVEVNNERYILLGSVNKDDKKKDHFISYTLHIENGVEVYYEHDDDPESTTTLKPSGQPFRGSKYIMLYEKESHFNNRKNSLRAKPLEISWVNQSCFIDSALQILLNTDLYDKIRDYSPAVTTPAVTTPAVTTPAVTTPAVTTPAVTTGYRPAPKTGLESLDVNQLSELMSGDLIVNIEPPLWDEDTYLIDQLIAIKRNPEDETAIDYFNQYRGYPIEIINLILQKLGYSYNYIFSIIYGFWDLCINTDSPLDSENSNVYYFLNYIQLFSNTNEPTKVVTIKECIDEFFRNYISDDKANCPKSKRIKKNIAFVDDNNKYLLFDLSRIINKIKIDSEISFNERDYTIVGVITYEMIDKNNGEFVNYTKYENYWYMKEKIIKNFNDEQLTEIIYYRNLLPLTVLYKLKDYNPTIQNQWIGFGAGMNNEMVATLQLLFSTDFYNVIDNPATNIKIGNIQHPPTFNIEVTTPTVDEAAAAAAAAAAPPPAHLLGKGKNQTPLNVGPPGFTPYTGTTVYTVPATITGTVPTTTYTAPTTTYTAPTTTYTAPTTGTVLEETNFFDYSELSRFDEETMCLFKKSCAIYKTSGRLEANLGADYLQLFTKEISNFGSLTLIRSSFSDKPDIIIDRAATYEDAEHCNLVGHYFVNLITDKIPTFSRVYGARENCKDINNRFCFTRGNEKSVMYQYIKDTIALRDIIDSLDVSSFIQIFIVIYSSLVYARSVHGFLHNDLNIDKIAILPLNGKINIPTLGVNDIEIIPFIRGFEKSSFWMDGTFIERVEGNGVIGDVITLLNSIISVVNSEGIRGVCNQLIGIFSPFEIGEENQPEMQRILENIRMNENKIEENKLRIEEIDIFPEQKLSSKISEEQVKEYNAIQNIIVSVDKDIEKLKKLKITTETLLQIYVELANIEKYNEKLIVFGEIIDRMRELEEEKNNLDNASNKILQDIDERYIDLFNKNGLEDVGENIKLSIELQKEFLKDYSKGNYNNIPLVYYFNQKSLICNKTAEYALNYNGPNEESIKNIRYFNTVTSIMFDDIYLDILQVMNINPSIAYQEFLKYFTLVESTYRKFIEKIFVETLLHLKTLIQSEKISSEIDADSLISKYNMEDQTFIEDINNIIITTNSKIVKLILYDLMQFFISSVFSKAVDVNSFKKFIYKNLYEEYIKVAVNNLTIMERIESGEISRESFETVIEILDLVEKYGLNNIRIEQIESKIEEEKRKEIREIDFESKAGEVKRMKEEVKSLKEEIISLEQENKVLISEFERLNVIKPRTVKSKTEKINDCYILDSNTLLSSFTSDTSIISNIDYNSIRCLILFGISNIPVSSGDVLVNILNVFNTENFCKPVDLVNFNNSAQFEEWKKLSDEIYQKYYPLNEAGKIYSFTFELMNIVYPPFEGESSNFSSILNYDEVYPVVKNMQSFGDWIVYNITFVTSKDSEITSFERFIELYDKRVEYIKVNLIAAANTFADNNFQNILSEIIYFYSTYLILKYLEIYLNSVDQSYFNKTKWKKYSAFVQNYDQNIVTPFRTLGKAINTKLKQNPAVVLEAGNAPISLQQYVTESLSPTIVNNIIRITSKY